MAAAIIDVYRALDQWAPFDTQMDFDNAGFLVGRGEREVRRVLVSLDITEAVAAEAGRWGAAADRLPPPGDFSSGEGPHRPDQHRADPAPAGGTGYRRRSAPTPIWTPPRGASMTVWPGPWSWTGVELLCRDGTDGQGRPYGIGRVGTAHSGPACSAAEFAAFIKEKLLAPAASVSWTTGRPVRRVAVGGGACASMLSDALAAGCDTFVTADVKYDQYLEAKALGINLMDAGHFATEDVVCPALVQFLSRHFPKVEVRRTETHREAYDSV